MQSFSANAASQRFRVFKRSTARDKTCLARMALHGPSLLSTLISFLVLGGVGIFGKIHYVWRLTCWR